MNKNSTSIQTSERTYSSVRTYTSTSSKASRFESEFTDPINLGIKRNPTANNDNIDNLLDTQTRSEPNLKEYVLQKVPLKASDVVYHSFPELMNNTCSDKRIDTGRSNKIMESLQNTGEHVRVFYACGGLYIGEIKEGKRHGIGKMSFASYEIYEGEWMEDHMHGKGKYEWLTGSMYNGYFKDDKFHGFGIAKANEGNYEGEWKEGLRDGQGKMTFQNHPQFLSYEGFWSKGKMVKKGKFDFKNGDTYEGAFEGDGIKNGTGDYIWSKNHMSYSGSWKNGCRDGEGRMECSQGGIYEGAWKNDKMEGNGRIQVNTAGNKEFTFGSFSDVEWQDREKCEFRGTFTTPAGGYYKGDWLQFRKHGKDGECLDADGITVKGNFVANYPSGEVMVQFPHLSGVQKLKIGLNFNPADPFQLRSQLSNGKWKANGRKKYYGKLGNGAIYYGEWDDNLQLPQGKGGMIYPDQSMYKGQFEKGKRHGKGEQTAADGSKKYSGIWKNDMKDGEFIVEYSSGLIEQLIYKNDQDPKSISEEEEQKLDPTLDSSRNFPLIDKKIASSIQNQPKNKSPRQQRTFIYPCGLLGGYKCYYY